MQHESLIYPAPTIVVGVGRFGLATMERLAEDWQRLKLSSEDPSIKNLRMLHVRRPTRTPSAPGAPPSATSSTSPATPARATCPRWRSTS